MESVRIYGRITGWTLYENYDKLDTETNAKILILLLCKDRYFDSIGTHYNTWCSSFEAEEINKKSFSRGGNFFSG